MRLPHVARMIAGLLLGVSSGGAWANGFDFTALKSSPTGSWAEAVTVGDVNGDRLDDVVVATTAYFDEPNDHRVFVYRQRSDGSLATPVKYKYSDSIYRYRVAVALGDLNEDGALDIVTGHHDGLFVLLSNGSGGFAERTFTPPATTQYPACSSLAILDIDADGHLDIVGGEFGATLFYGDGRGDIASMVSLPLGNYYDIKAGDVTGDGKPDLVTVGWQLTIFPADGNRGIGPGVAYPAPSTWSLGAVALGDFDGDDLNEVVISVAANQPESKLYLYRQDASGRLQSNPQEIASADIPKALIAHDLDRDGRQDLLVGHDGWSMIGRYMQGLQGLDTVEQTNAASFNDGPNALAIGDFNDDGCSDAAIADHFSGLVTLHGTGCVKGRPSSDFDGDGISDLLWRNEATGANVIWRSGNYGTQQTVRGVSNTSWIVAGIGDFNGDTKADILWHNDATSANIIWKAANANSTQVVASVIDRAWKILGVGDFDGDGKDDIFWRDTSNGRNAIWKGGDNRMQMPVTAVTDLLWNVVGIGDFDGDTKADLLWRHSTSGRNAIWLSANFSTQKSIVGLTDLNWQIAGVGDFDGDLKADILWRHLNGANAIWKSADHSHGERLAAQSSEWRLAAIGDYDGNGKEDLVWRHTSSGENTIWRSAIKTVTKPVTRVTNLDWAIQK